MPYTARGLGSKVNLQGIIANAELQLAGSIAINSSLTTRPQTF